MKIFALAKHVDLAPPLEEQYRKVSAERLLPYMRSVAIFGTLIPFPWLFWDHYIMHGPMLPLICLRAAMAILFVLLFVSLSGRRAADIVQTATVLIILGAVIDVSLVLVNVENGFNWGISGVLIPFLLIPILADFSWAAMATVISVLLTNLIMVFDHIDLNSIINANFFLCSFGILCVVISYFGVRHRRASFLLEMNLAKAKQDAEQANHAKSNFLATMSHEVRTPLNGILGIVTLLKDTRLDYQQHDLIETISYSGETLLGMLNDILDFSKMEAGKFEIENVDFNLRRTVESVISLMKSRAAEKNINLRCDIGENVPAFVKSDPVRLRQVLLNLISNALKFTNRGSIVLSISVSEHTSAPLLCFEIIDTGIGIPEEVQSNLFQEFVQADSSISRRYGGTGLGLAICKNIVQLMKGEIGVRSTIGAGSTFWFTVPAIRAEAAEDIEARFSADNTSTEQIMPCSILVAEDNIINRKIITGLLQRCGHYVTIVTNGAEAVDMLKKNIDFDLVLMDMQMPVMDGLSATRQIRALGERYRKIPIIALTANAMASDEEKCVAAGMDDFVSKPINPDHLYKVLARHAPRTMLAGLVDDEKIASSGRESEKKSEFSKLAYLEKFMGKNYIDNFMQEGLVELNRLVGSIVEQTTNQNSGDEVQHAAHEIRSLSAMFGLDQVSTLAADIESCCAAQRYAEVEELGTLLRDRYATESAVLKTAYRRG